MSHPEDWTVRTKEGYYTIIRSPDGRLEYGLYAEPISESFADFRRETKVPAERPGRVVVSKDIEVDGRQAFYVHRTYAKERPRDWAGEQWCGGCVERDYYIDWGGRRVLHAEASGVLNWTRYEDVVERIVESLSHD